MSFLLLTIQAHQPETLKLQFYTAPSGKMIKELKVSITDEIPINSGLLQKGNYIVKILKDNVMVESIRIWVK